MPENKEHSAEDYWKELSEQRNKLGNVENSISGFGARISNIETSVGRIESYISQPRKVNWVGIGTLILSTIALTATYIQARLNPIEESQRSAGKFDERVLDEMLSSSHESGQQEESLRQLERTQDILLTAAFKFTEDHALLKRLTEDVDEHHAKGDHPFGVLGQVQELRGLTNQLKEQVNREKP